MSERGNVRKHAGSCHCGAVKFEIDVDATSGMRCNCTVCTKVGLLMGMAKPEGFRILVGRSSTPRYREVTEAAESV